FQAEDGIRDLTVTGVQTCALPIFCSIFEELFAELGRPITREEYFACFAGHTDDEIVRRWLGHDFPDPDAVVEERITRYLAIAAEDRKSTRLNSSHSQISYAVFCLK